MYIECKDNYPHELNINNNKNCYNNISTLLNEIIKNIQDTLINNFDTTSIDNGDDYISERDKMTYIITTTKNQERQIFDNVTTIDLSNCATKLKDEYNISKNDSLNILMVDKLEDYIHKIEYEVYYNFSLNNLTKLNLTSCEGIRIDISFPRDIPKNEIDKYNKSSGFYNDICYTFTSNSGTDESLNDRKNEYKLNNLSICEEDCDFSSYNEKSKKVICSCFTKLNMPLISDIKVDKNKLFSNFKDIRNVGNFKMLSCIRLFFNKSNIFIYIVFYNIRIHFF